ADDRVAPGRFPRVHGNPLLPRRRGRCTFRAGERPARDRLAAGAAGVWHARVRPPRPGWLPAGVRGGERVLTRRRGFPITSIVREGRSVDQWLSTPEAD